MIKVLILSLAYYPFVGGAEVAIKEITDRLGGGFSFDMITVNLDGKQMAKEKIGNITVYRIGTGKLSKYKFPWKAGKYAQKLHLQNKYDIVWAMMANQAGWATMKFKKNNPDVKYLLTLQEGDSEADIWLKTFLIRPIYKKIYQSADRIQAISRYLAKRAKKMGAKCKIDIIPNGVFVGGDKSEITNHKSKIILTASRLVKKNGIEDLVRAMKYIDARLIILGGGKLRNRLENIYRDLGLTDKIDFIGEVDNDKVYDYLASADVFVRPSLSEGLGNAFLEAMSLGVPTVGTPVGGIVDFLKDGKTGWLCEVKNPKSIADKVNYILDEKNKDEVKQVAKVGKKLVIEKYNWNSISEKMGEIFNEIYQ